MLLPVLPSRLTTSARSSVSDRLRAPLGWIGEGGRGAWYIVHWRRLAHEVEALRGERDRLIGEVVVLREASQENERLRSLLSFRKEFTGRTVPARVIGRDPVRWSHSLILDRGRKAGIREGAAVVTPGGLVGRISEVGSVTSKVLLLLDPNCRLAGLVQRTRESGLVTGSADGRLRMFYLPETTASLVGDTVITAGLGGHYPKGLLIGTVHALHREVDGLSATALIDPAIAAERLEEVLVVVE